MAIYRPPKPRWPLAIAAGVAGLLIGLVIGLAIGGRDPEPSAIAGDLGADLVAAAGSLEVAEIEYAESVDDGEIVRQAEYDGALGAIESSHKRYLEVAPVVESVAPETAREIEDLYEECTASMRDRVDADTAADCLGELRTALTGEP